MRRLLVVHQSSQDRRGEAAAPRLMGPRVRGRDRLVEAWERGDVDAIAAMLAEDALFAMPPRAAWYDGREAVAEFLAARPLSGSERWHLVPARASGQLAFGHYVWDESTGRFRAHAINVLTLRGDRIAEITIFLTPEAFDRFGLPADLDPTPGSG